jgi:hypothetical protein
VKRIFIASPFRAPTPDLCALNVSVAKDLFAAVLKAGHAPFAPHLAYTSYLDDNDPSERKQGIAAGLLWLRMSDELWVYARTEAECSAGMKSEIEAAQAFQLPIRTVFMPEPFEEVERRWLAKSRATPIVRPADVRPPE